MGSVVVSMGRLLWLLFSFHIFAGVRCRFVIEKAGLKIVLPDSARQQYVDGFEMSLANFGAPVYGGELVGKLVYPDTEFGYPSEIRCEPPCRFACQPFNESQPPFDLTADRHTTYILLVDRGPTDIAGINPCKFAEKTWNAQQAGAKGVVVVNYENKHTTMYAPDDEDQSLKWLKNISIPSVFITKSDGDVLKDLLRDGNDLIVSLDWNDALPHQKQVEWEFWTNSNDMCGAKCDNQRDFIKEFAPVAKDLEQHNWTRFTPHYKVWRCPDSYKNSEECARQCIHQGRYCSPPEESGHDGREIVQENLRQLCVFRLANQSGSPWMWWDYVSTFAERCKMSEGMYGKDCAQQVFIDLGGNDWGGGLEKFDECIGDMDADTTNTILEGEYEAQVGGDSVGEVYILPTIRINNAQYRGKLGFTEVLRALCSGFDKNFEPEVCLKVSDNECLPGALGDEECSKNTGTGKTRCFNTFVGYGCTCGNGFITHTLDSGEEECLDVNECRSAGTSLGHNCTCDRCACKNTWGSFECITDLADECSEDNSYGGCWHESISVGGNKQLFSACKDQLYSVKQAAADGGDISGMALHTCECPPCFRDDGSGVCVAACQLDSCDLNTGACGAAVPQSSVPGWGVFIALLLAIVLVGAGGYLVYWYRLRSAMHKEIRAIMVQYMPLEGQGDTTLAPVAPSHNDGQELKLSANGI